MMKWLVNIANKSLLAITLLVINLWLLINDWSNHAFAGTMELDSSNKNEMIRFNVNNQFWQQPQGFLWYNEDHAYTPEILKFSQDKKKQEPELEPYNQRIEALKKEFNRAQHQALDDPTLENVIIAQRLHKQILEKSHKFATMWQLATILDYKLVNMDEPVNSLHKKLYEVRQEEENSQKLRFLAKNWGLILQVNQGCNYCQAFTPIVREFADKYGFQLIFVSNSETRFQGMPTIKDTGLLKTLQNMPNNFGIYYKDPSNSVISFKTCKQVTPLIKAAINKELNDGLLTQFANGIGISSNKQELLASRLKAMTSDTLKYLKKEQTDIHQWMRQAMLLNANREAYDDLREKFSLARIYPQLVSMNVTRGLFQQSFSYLVAGEMAANIMPILQSVFFALVICLIFVVFPMSMLPGGYTIFKTWITLIIWVTSWPVFFTVIHCLGIISLAGKGVSHLTGLNILSQGSFSEMVLHEFATFQMLAASVPMLSWAVLKACAHATTTLANQFSPVPVASSIGANIADNNLSMDNYNIGNRTIAQQNLTPTLQLAGGIIDDGGMRVTSTDSGRQVLAQAVDSLVNNYRSSKLLQDSYQSQFMSSQSYLDSLNDRYSDLTTTGNSIATEIGKRLSYEEAKSIGITDSQYLALQQMNSDSTSATDHTGSSNRKDTGTSADIGLNIPSLGGTKVISTNDQGKERGKSVNQQQSYNEALSKIKSATKDGRLSNANSNVQSLSNNLNSNFSEQQSVGQEIARTKQNIEQLSYNMNYIAQNSAAIDRNLNEPVLNAIVAKNIPGVSSKEQAAMWTGTHREEAEQIALDIAKIDNTIPQNLSSVSNVNIPSKESLRSSFDENKQRLNDQAAISSIDDRKNDIYDKNVEQMLIQSADNNEIEKVKILEQLSDKVKNKREQIEDEFNKTPESTIVRTGQQIADNIGISDKAIKKRNRKLLDYKNKNN